ncbi:hypothetical protein TEA_027278 [Camellia sinensis var. sinensis]|uniref:Nudix hydrolase domain-containing protein n=1 Tax=Camellia sinensis var. sinensis TaxID=542762 RepID=A0A4S4D2M5_CAMSN|nr:hypothetical protein TEA_027278 [Camellia sinensis var. sinensis]
MLLTSHLTAPVSSTRFCFSSSFTLTTTIFPKSPSFFSSYLRSASTSSTPSILLTNPPIFTTTTSTSTRRRTFSPRSSSPSSAAMVDAAAAASDAGMDAVQRRLMCILVDENDRVVGHDTKYNCHLMEKIESENLLHRAFSVFLFNSKYEGEKCCTKEAYELGIPAKMCQLISSPIGSHVVQAHLMGSGESMNVITLALIQSEPQHVCIFDYLLFIVRDVNVNPNPDEVADVKYVNRDELKELLRKADAGEGGLKLSPWFRLVVDNFLLKWWDNVEKGTLQEAADMKTIHKLI